MLELSRRLRREQSGSIMITAGFTFLLLIVMGGAAVDYARAVSTRTTLANAIDSAALAAAKQLSLMDMTDAAVKKVVEDVVAANIGDKYQDVSYRVDSVTVVPAQGTVTVDASADVPTFFVKLAGINNLNVSNVSQVTYSRFDVELAIVVDVTESMEDDMQALREATQRAVDILLPSYVTPGNSKVKMSIVPYSTGVNAGRYAARVSNGSASNKCVTERGGSEKSTDAWYKHSSNMQPWEYFGGGTSTCSSSQLLPLTDNRDTLTSRISSLEAASTTAGQVGIAWGWYTISPTWSALWPGDSQPEPYTNDDVKKVMLIMTDGAFNTWYDYKTKTECSPWACYVVGGKWKRTFEKYAGYSDEPSIRARALCNKIKAKHIHIYTVYFNTGGSGADDSMKLMRYCATDAKSYFVAQDDAQLKAEFGRIAKDIQDIYLSK